MFYIVVGMIDKNKDIFIKDILDFIEGSKDLFLYIFFFDKVDYIFKKRFLIVGDKIKLFVNLFVENFMK